MRFGRTEKQHIRKKQKTDLSTDSTTEMAFFAQSSTQFLSAPSAPFRRRPDRLPRQQDDIDEFLSSDLELSFASNVSLNSPPRDPIALTPESEYADAMDISPAPKSAFARPFVSDKPLPLGRPRAFTTAARIFGSDVSNKTASTTTLVAPTSADKADSSTQSSSKRIQRAALPLEWMTTRRASDATRPTEIPFLAPPFQGPTTPSDDAMDVDTSFSAEVALSPSPSFPLSAAPTITSFNTLFYDTMSPRRSYESPVGPLPKKRRSVSPESSPHEASSSSPGLVSSPSDRRLLRKASHSLLSSFSKPSLQGLGTPPPQPNGTKRGRRPALSAMVHPTELSSIQSAFPVLSSTKHESYLLPSALPAPRRAFSALIPPSAFTEGLSDESSFDGPDMSSPAQAYAQRQQVKTIRRCDGTDDFRPLTGATAMTMNESPTAKHMGAGMPGFGDNEAHGKILPCHRVSEDGLMRIRPQTLDALLDGHFESQIHDFHVIDCRFDYEYNGGHIPGAVNINTTNQVEAMLLGMLKPKASVSGDTAKKTVLVFHCEFSAKRAPTFAKHLRAKDRAMNNHNYPKIHYPEVYILEGGYCNYFKSSSHRCEPSAYVTMDDPVHAASRREDLDQFRKAKFGRHKSYAYGDGASKVSSLSTQAKRNTAPSGGSNPLFAAATAARTRRGGGPVALSTLAEDGNVTADADDTDTDIGDSPCPPPTKATAVRGKKAGRGMVRAETYGPTRLPLSMSNR